MTKALRNAYGYNSQTIVSIADFQSAALTERTAYGNGTDIRPLIAEAGDYLRNKSNTARGVVTVPAGKWRMGSAADDDKLAGLQIIGDGAQATQIFYDATSGVMFNFDGENTSAGWSGGGISKCRLILGAASLGGGTPTCLRLQGVNVSGTYSEPDDFLLNNVYINAETPGTARWYNGFFAYGNDRTSPQGIRVATINDLQAFDCTNLGIYMSNIVQWNISNIGTYTGTGTGNDIHITGGGSTSTNSTQVFVSSLLCSGTLTMANCSDVSVFGKAASLAISSADYCHGFINVSGSVSGAFGANSDVILK